jgi:signal transduction histidine kinase
MGIGVFESRAYIRELGGQIKVFSRQSVGTTFRLILPLFDYEAQVAKRFG